MSRKHSTTTNLQPLVLEQATIQRDEHVILSQVNLSLQAGDFAYLTGGIGVGKSSILETIYGELPLITGKGSVLGYNLNKLSINKRQAMRRQMGIVFQSGDQLLYDRTIEQNLDFVLKVTSSGTKSERKSRIKEALDGVGMSGKGYRYPHELSGGEKTRVSIARALIVKPQLILLDEPTTGLDMDTSIDIGRLIQSIAQQGPAVLMSTHNTILLEQLPAQCYNIEGQSCTLID